MHEKLDFPDSLTSAEEKIEPGCDIVGDNRGISTNCEGEIDPDEEFALFDKVTF